MKNNFIAIAVMLFISISGYAQTSVINGKITDIKGDPIEGVVIKIQNSEIFTESDQYGEFHIDAKENEEAEISHINFKSKTIYLVNNTTIVLEERSIELGNIIQKITDHSRLSHLLQWILNNKHDTRRNQE